MARIGDLYDLQAFKKFKDSAKKPSFKDSAGGVVLARNLTAVDPKIFELKYPALAFVNSGIQVDNTGGYARMIQSLRVIGEGDFADTRDASTNTGKISLRAENNYLEVYEKEAFSEWTDDEIKEAEMQNINLVENYLKTHNKKYLQKVDEIGLLGHNNQLGLLNYSGFDVVPASDTIDNLDAEGMYNEISNLIIGQRQEVNNIPEYSCNVVMMPIKVMNKLQGTILNSAGGSKSVLKALQDNYPDVKFIASFRCENVNGTSVTVAYSTNREAMVMRIPVRLTIGEIVKVTSFKFRIDSKFRIAGLDVLEEASARKLIGL